MASLVFIGHEASLTGAPYTQLYLIQWLRAHTDHTVQLVLLRGGPLLAEFEKVATVHILHQYEINPPFIKRVIRKLETASGTRKARILNALARTKPGLIYANTVPTIHFAVEVKQHLLVRKMMSVPLLLHVHELDSIFFSYVSAEIFAQQAKEVNFFIPCAQAVKTFYQEKFRIPDDKMQIVYDYAGQRSADTSTATSVRNEFSISAGTPLVGAVGTLGWRKGSDLFLQVVKCVAEIGRNDVKFIWLGVDPDSPECKSLVLDACRLGLSEQILFVKARPDVKGFYEAFDIFLLTSREDPFPLVCMEAASQACPIICFEQGGGMPEFVRDDAGFIVPYGDTAAMAEKTVYLLDHAAERQQMGQVGKQRALDNHTIEATGPQFYQIIQSLVNQE